MNMFVCYVMFLILFESRTLKLANESNKQEKKSVIKDNRDEKED